jgi:hypothetical protein
VVLVIFTGAVTVDRFDFGIMGGDAHNDWFDRARSATMGDSVRISLEIHGWMPDSANPALYTRITIARVDSIGIDSAASSLRAAFARDSAGVAASEAALDIVGRALLDRGRAREGFLWLHAIARTLPRSVNAMVSVGLANQRMGDTTRARIWYEQAVAADSLDSRAALQIVSALQGDTCKLSVTWTECRRHSRRLFRARAAVARLSGTLRRPHSDSGRNQRQ